MTSGLDATAAATDPAAPAPSATSAAALPGLRFHTVVGWPARTNARASAEPMSPSPMTVTAVRRSFAMSFSPSSKESPGRRPGPLPC